MVYVNREALLERLAAIADATENPVYLIAMRTAMAEIGCAPEEDVVKVVRCKDCKRARPADWAAITVFGEARAENIRVCGLGDNCRLSDYFCPHGEPREDE